MRVLFIHQAFVSPSDAGGSRHFELFKYCARKKCSFAVITSRISYLTGINKKTPPNQDSNDPISVAYAYSPSALHRSFFWRIVCFIVFMLSSIYQAIKVNNVDLVMGTTPPIFQAVSAWIVAMLKRRPFILEVRDLWPEFAIDMGVLKRPLLIALSRGLEKFLYRRADHIIVNSPAYVDYLENKGVLARKITLVANGVDPEMFETKKRKGIFRSKYNLTKKFLVTYAGALGLANDIKTIVMAADTLRDNPSIHFLIAGDGKERVNLQSQVKILKLHNMTFTGALPKNVIPQLLAESDLCVAALQNVPMFKMTYPNKVFDYMAAGRPTIVSIDGVIRKVIKDSDGGLFSKPGDHSMLAEKIQYCYQHPRECRRMGKSARAFVVQHFSRQNQAEKLFQLIVSFQPLKCYSKSTCRVEKLA